jgi:DEAD/DEAH box helicase domain-containing protein
VIYDLAPGGMGFSEKAYEIIDDVIRITIRTLKKCHCDDGCPNCVGFSGLSKKLILKILRRITGFRA